MNIKQITTLNANGVEELIDNLVYLKQAGVFNRFKGKYRLKLLIEEITPEDNLAEGCRIIYKNIDNSLN